MSSSSSNVHNQKGILKAIALPQPLSPNPFQSNPICQTNDDTTLSEREAIEGLNLLFLPSQKLHSQPPSSLAAQQVISSSIALPQRKWALSVIEEALHQKNFSNLPERVSFLPGYKLSNEIFEGLLRLTRSNMKDMYDNNADSEFAWCDKRKRGELLSKGMQWLLVSSDDDNDDVEREVIAFAAFRFTLEDDEEVPHTYLHELQVCCSQQRQGLGGMLLHTLLDLSNQVKMPLILLTVFPENVSAMRFYRQHGFVVDESSPSACFMLPPHIPPPYEILSMPLQEAHRVMQFSCQECIFSCRFADSLLHHQCRVHAKPWPFPCVYCPPGIGTLCREQLEQHHIRMKHHIRSKKKKNCFTTELVEDDKMPTSQDILYSRVYFPNTEYSGTVVKLYGTGLVDVRLDGRQVEIHRCRVSAFKTIPDEDQANEDQDFSPVSSTFERRRSHRRAKLIV